MHPGAPPEQFGSSPWTQEPASGRPKAEDVATFLHHFPPPGALASGDKVPRRLVISIGGAGAQATFVIELLAALQPGMAAGTWHVILNCGDLAPTQARIQAALPVENGFFPA